MNVAQAVQISETVLLPAYFGQARAALLTLQVGCHDLLVAAKHLTGVFRHTGLYVLHCWDTG